MSAERNPRLGYCDWHDSQGFCTNPAAYSPGLRGDAPAYCRGHSTWNIQGSAPRERPAPHWADVEINEMIRENPALRRQSGESSRDYRARIQTLIARLLGNG